MTLGNCVHCEDQLDTSGKGLNWLYPLSRFAAHLRCVSQVSSDATDLLLLGYRAPRHVHREPR